MDGKRLNSPNDLVVKSDGSIWFTDPTFGILGYYEGHLDTSERPMAVYRWDPATGAARVVADDIAGPNGLAFSPDEKLLYVVASRAEPRALVVYDVVGEKLAHGRPFIDAGPHGTPDGFRVDIDGNLWCGWGMGAPELDGVRVFNPGGEPIGHVRLARTGGESMLRGTLAEPAVHGGEPWALCVVREHAGGGGRVGEGAALDPLGPGGPRPRTRPRV